jgi:hypothetical protein
VADVWRRWNTFVRKPLVDWCYKPTLKFTGNKDLAVASTFLGSAFIHWAPHVMFAGGNWVDVLIWNGYMIAQGFYILLEKKEIVKASKVKTRIFLAVSCYLVALRMVYIVGWV